MGIGEQDAGQGAGDRRAQHHFALAEYEAEGGHKQRRQEPAHAGHRQQVAAHIGVPPQYLGGEYGEQEPGRMQDDVGDYRQQHHLEQGPLAAPYIAQALYHIGQGIAALPGVAGAVVGRPHRPEHQHVGQVEAGFHSEVPKEAQGENQNAADEGPENAGAGDGEDIGGQGVAQHFPGDGGGNQGLAHRLGHGMADAGQDHIQVGVPDGHAAGKHQQGEGEGQRRHNQLEDDDQPAAVEAVAQHAAPGSEDQSGQGVDAAYGDYQQAGYGGAFGQIPHQPAHAEELQPLGAVGEEVAAPEQAVVGIGQPGVQGAEARQSWDAKNVGFLPMAAGRGREGRVRGPGMGRGRARHRTRVAAL